MNINKDSQFVSIPRYEYEQMEEIVKEKKDINISFMLRQQLFNGSHYILNTYSIIHEFNDKLKLSEVDIVTQLINDSIERVTIESDMQQKILQEELSTIKNKWWYKLFNFK